MINVLVVAIKLTRFQYDIEYEPAEGAEIRYTVRLLHRPHPSEKNIDVLVDVSYSAQDHDKPVLQAACLTTFHVPDAKVEASKEDETETMTVTNEQGKRLTHEAISHARAIIAIHTAATPFSTSHIAIGDVVTAGELKERGLDTPLPD